MGKKSNRAATKFKLVLRTGSWWQTKIDSNIDIAGFEGKVLNLSADLAPDAVEWE